MDRLVLIVMVLTLAGCASLQMGNETRSIDAPADAGFEAAAHTLRAAGFEIKTADPDKGWIETERLGVHEAKTPWARDAEQVRVRVEALGSNRARIRLFIAFADDVSDSPRKSRPRRKKQGPVYERDQTPMGRFFDSSAVYDDVLDAIEQRAEQGR